MEQDLKPDEIESREWDIIVVGAGMGGAVLGYSLAKAGKRVLFCERGRSHLSGSASLMGDYAEHFCSRPEHGAAGEREVFARSGRWADEIEDASTARRHRFVPFIGSGTGGSSALYGMAMERFFPSDFTPKEFFRDADGFAIPDQWPVSHGEMVPYYEEAERLFRVRGTPDPLKGMRLSGQYLTPPPLTPVGQELTEFFASRHLNPYYLPVACEFVEGCTCCQSYLCPNDCKNDSARICLKPAINGHGARIIDECEVLRLEECQGRVSGVVALWRGKQRLLRGNVVVLAAGALETPKILLNSASSAWPDGLANRSGLVGRNLMRHYIDLYALVRKGKGETPLSFKELAFNDYYVRDGKKYGTVQSFGAMPPASILVEGMRKDLKKKSALASTLFGAAKPFMGTVLRSIFAKRVVLATIMEDLPRHDNRVTVSASADPQGRRRTVIEYRINGYEQSRIAEFRREMASLLAPYSFMLIKQAENNERIAHACGTCRFGADPASSVLDPFNRAHDLENLYVVDSSFFPTSGGTNPALTIAANALRVAEHIRETIKG